MKQVFYPLACMAFLLLWMPLTHAGLEERLCYNSFLKEWSQATSLQGCACEDYDYSDECLRKVLEAGLDGTSLEYVAAIADLRPLSALRALDLFISGQLPQQVLPEHISVCGWIPFILAGLSDTCFHKLISGELIEQGFFEKIDTCTIHNDRGFYGTSSGLDEGCLEKLLTSSPGPLEILWADLKKLWE